MKITGKEIRLTHEEYQGLSDDYTKGKLDDWERALVQEHIVDCEECSNAIVKFIENEIEDDNVTIFPAPSYPPKEIFDKIFRSEQQWEDVPTSGNKINVYIILVKVLLELEKQRAKRAIKRIAAHPVNINPQRSVPALILTTMEQTFVEVTAGPFFYPDGRLSLDIEIPAANLPEELKQEVKVDLLFLPIGEIMATFTLSPEKEESVKVELPAEDADLEKLLGELKEVAGGPIELPVAAVSFRIR